MRTRACLAILALAFTLPYLKVNAWTFPAALPLVLLAARGLWGRAAWERLGWSVPLREGALAALLLVGLVWIARLGITELATREGIRLDFTRWSGALGTRPIFQVLSEEMAFRAVLLGALARHFAPSRANLGVALFFAAAHIPFYWLKDGSWIGLTATVNLALFGAALGLLYLKRGHIAWALALHLAWNFTRFGADFIAPDGTVLAEGALYPTLEGSAWVTAAAAITLSLALRIAPRGSPAPRPPDPPSGSGR